MPTPSPTEIERRAWVDEYGELSRRIAEMKPALDRHKALGVLIQMWFEGTPAEQPAIVEGHRYTLQISPRENQTTIPDIRKCYRTLGVTKFLDACSLTLKALRDSCSPENFSKLTRTERTGNRTIKAVAKAPEPAIQKAA